MHVLRPPVGHARYEAAHGPCVPLRCSQAMCVQEAARRPCVLRRPLTGRVRSWAARSPCVFLGHSLAVRVLRTVVVVCVFLGRSRSMLRPLTVRVCLQVACWSGGFFGCSCSVRLHPAGMSNVAFACLDAMSWQWDLNAKAGPRRIFVCNPNDFTVFTAGYTIRVAECLLVISRLRSSR